MAASPAPSDVVEPVVADGPNDAVAVGANSPMGSGGGNPEIRAQSNPGLRAQSPRCLNRRQINQRIYSKTNVPAAVIAKVMKAHSEVMLTEFQGGREFNVHGLLGLGAFCVDDGKVNADEGALAVRKPKRAVRICATPRKCMKTMLVQRSRASARDDSD